MENNQNQVGTLTAPEKSKNGLLILGILISIFACFIIIVPLIHIFGGNYKTEYWGTVAVGFIILSLGGGLIFRNYWAWIANVIVFSFVLLSNLFSLIIQHNEKAISNSVLAIIVLAVLSSCKKHLK